MNREPRRWGNVALIAALALASACGARPIATQPPEAYQADAVVLTIYATNPDAECRALGSTTKQDFRIEACFKPLNLVQTVALLMRRGTFGVIVKPNPCKWPDAGGEIGQLDCHEKGHALGGRHDDDQRWTGT